jgi:hypothetical protein
VVSYVSGALAKCEKLSLYENQIGDAGITKNQKKLKPLFFVMVEICLPDDVWEYILLYDTRNSALDALNHKSRAIMYKARQNFPHGRFSVSFQRLMTFPLSQSRML